MEQWARNQSPDVHLGSWGTVCIGSDYLAIQHRTRN